VRARLIGTVTVLVALSIALTVATDSPIAAASAVLVAAVAAVWAGAAAVTAQRTIGAHPQGQRTTRADPAPRHPGTPGRPRPRAPGRGLPAA
jgi:hypothetical protein